MNSWPPLITAGGTIPPHVVSRGLETYQAIGNDHRGRSYLHNMRSRAGRATQEAAPRVPESMKVFRSARRRHQTLDAFANYGRLRSPASWRAAKETSASMELDRQARGRARIRRSDLVNLGMVRLDMQRHAEAEKDFRAALDIYAETLPADHPYVVSALSGLGRCMLEQNRLGDAEQTLRRAKEIGAKSVPADSPQLAAANSSLGRVLIAQRRPDEAAQLLRESYPILVQSQGENAVITQRAREAMAQLDATR